MGENKGKILVKKSDGSAVYMSLAEFQTYQKNQGKGQKTIATPPSSPETNTEVTLKSEKEVGPTPPLSLVKDSQTGIQKEEKKTEVAVLGVEMPAITTPVKEIFLAEAKAKLKQWHPDDYRSPLEEEAKTAVADPSVSKVPDHSFEAVLREIRFPVSDEITPQLRSLVATRLRGIRDDQQVEEYARRERKKGGLGWSEDQAQALVLILSRMAAGSAGSRKQTTVVRLRKNTSGNLPLTKTITDLTSGVAPQGLSRENKQTISLSSSQHRPLIQDIKPQPVSTPSVPLEETTVGPVEELRRFTLVDWRRLGKNQEEIVAALETKFQNLKKDSYLLFLEGKQAWQGSPIYSDYLAVLKGALEKTQKINDYLSAQANSFTPEEFANLIILNQALN